MEDLMDTKPLLRQSPVNSFSELIFFVQNLQWFFNHPLDPFRVQWSSFGDLRSVERRSGHSKFGYTLIVRNPR